MSDLKTAIMHRDDSTEEEADKKISEMKALFEAGDDPEDILHNEGFEPDYIFDLIDSMF